jgi:hypothetical protein
MKPWTRFLPNIQIEVMNCPRAVIVQAIRDTAIEFCEQTKAWQEIQDKYPVGGGLMLNEFVTDPGVKVYQVRAAEMENDIRLPIRTPEWCDEAYPGWRKGTVTGLPGVLTQLDPEHFILLPTPIEVSYCTLSVVLKPTRDSTKGPDFLFEDYYEAICAGAKGRLMLMKGKDWTDPQAAAVQVAFYNSKLAEANIRRSKAFGMAKVRVESQFL